MAERLTKKIRKTIQDKYSLGSYLYYDFAGLDDTNKLLNKLGRLEDILEKYGIESVEELSNALEFAKVIENILSEYSIKDNEELDKKIDDFTNFMKGNKFETIEDLQNALNGKFIEVFDEKNKIWQDMIKNLTKTEKERDTWERACELACEREDDCYVYDNIHRAYYFYQQAKTEGNDE